MRRCLGLVAFLLTFSILMTLSVSATEYTPQTYVYNLYANGEDYGGYLDDVAVTGATGSSMTGTFSVPTNLDSRFKSLLLGAYYKTSPSTDVEATYKFVITITTGVTGSYNPTTAPVLYGTVMKGRNSFTKSTATLLSQHGVYEANGNVYTFTYDSIPYDKMVGKTGLYIQTSLSSWSSALATEIYIVNSYFGLESYYDDDAYKSDVLTGLNNINDSLGNINNSIGDTNDKLDGIQDNLNNLYESDKNKAEDDLDGTSGEVDDVINTLPDYSDNYMSILGDIENAMMTTETTSTIPLPNGKVNILGHSIDIFAGHTEVDFSEILSNPDIQTLIRLGKGFSVIFTMGICVYWVYAIYSWFNGLGPEPEIPIVDPAFSSKSDHWGVKWR